MQMPSPIPLTIITGFLGSGKTTLLNQILHADHGLRVAVLVNDFGAINIDTQLVVGVEGETISLANGCICCTIRDDLLKAVLDLLQRSEPPEYIIIETSGVSDPLEVALTFRSLRQIYIDSILTVIDAEHILSLDTSYERLSTNQVRMADLLILNKVDLINKEQLEAVRRHIRALAPRARILETTHAVVPITLLLNIGTFDLHSLHDGSPQEVHVHTASDDNYHEHEEDSPHVHTDHTLVFNTWHWHSDQPVSYRALRQMVDHLPETIYRAKGIFFLVDDPDQKWVLHVVGQRTSLITLPGGWGEEAARSQLIVIGATGSIDAADLNQRMKACLAVEAPASHLEHIANRAIEWLRQRLP